MGSACGIAQALGVSQSSVLGAQRLVLSRLRVDPGDVFESGGEGVDLPGAVAVQAAQGVALGQGRGEGGIPLSVCRERGGDRFAAVTVEDVPVLVGSAQSPLIGLAVDGDEMLADLAEHPDGRRPAADVRPRSTLGSDGAGQHQLVFVELTAGVLRPLPGRVSGGQSHDALD